MSNTSHFHHQINGTKTKCIDRIYIKVIHRRIQDRMDKMTINRPLHLKRDYFHGLKFVINYCTAKSTKPPQKYHTIQ